MRTLTTILKSFMMSSARTLLNTKHDLGEICTDYCTMSSFVGYIAPYPPSEKRKRPTAVVAGTIGQAIGGGHGKLIVGEKFGC